MHSPPQCIQIVICTMKTVCMKKNVLIYKWLTLGNGVWAAVFPTLGSVRECSEASLCGNDGVRVGSHSHCVGWGQEAGNHQEQEATGAVLLLPPAKGIHNNIAGNNYNTQCMDRCWKCPHGVPH